MTNNSDEIDAVVQEFRAFCVTPDHQLPIYDSKADHGLDKFWFAMSVQKTVSSDLELPGAFAYSNLARLAKILLVLPHSNADPERLFSMLGKIQTQSRSQLSSSTTCNLLTIKMNHDESCYLSQNLMTDQLIQNTRSATRRCLQNYGGSSV